MNLEDFERDEVQALYHAVFTITNNEAPQHEPSAAMRAQMKLANVLGEDVPEAAIQNWEQTVARAREAARVRQLQFTEAHNQLAAQRPTTA
jgi:hypothetical protein